MATTPSHPRRSEGLHVLTSQAHEERDLLATYSITVSADTDICSLAERFAVGQTLGTWVEVPGVTADMRKAHQGRVVSIVSSPAVDLVHQLTDRLTYLIQIALPTVNFGADLAQLITTCLGNDASTSIQSKLVDLQMPGSFAASFGGPRFGIEGLRKLTGIKSRPLVLNMIKPCTGITPEQGARIFYATALGGVDLIKDDELLGDTEFSPLVDRIRAYEEAASRVEGETGHRALYIPNITAQGTRLLDNARRAVDAGARAVMVAYGSVGYGMLAEVASIAGVPVLGHYAGSGMFYEGPSSGMTAALTAGFFPRLAGADLALINTPYGGYPMLRSSYLDTARRLSLPTPRLKPTMPVVGGGVHAGVAELYLNELGQDIVLAPGGGIQGHPDGATAGARSVFQAIEAWQMNIPADEYSNDHPELATALEKFGYRTAVAP
jgi:2,3-diketo-5-methylthiopentyl-1-phosphate enolase